MASRPWRISFHLSVAGEIIHASLESEELALTGADVPPDRYKKPQGFAVLPQPSDPAKAESISIQLAENGRVQMPLEETFWAARFGMVTDRFGTPWMVNCGSQP